MKIITTIILLLTMATVFSEDIKFNKNDINTAPSPKSSRFSDREIQSQIDWALAPVKTRDALNVIVQNVSPLDLLSFDAKQRFVDNISFNKNGVTTFLYVDLEAELTPTEIYKILSLFGIQRFTGGLTNARVRTTTDKLITTKLLPKDFLLGYRCSSPGTCLKATDRACTANC